MTRFTKVFRSIARRQDGFTLIELLVVVAIMGVLAAVAVPNVARFAGRGATESRNTELQAVQAATDAYMADNALTSVTGSAALSEEVTDFTASDVPLGGDLYPDYIRNQNAISGYGYCWTTTGKVTQIAVAGTC